MPYKNTAVGKKKRDAMLERQDRLCALCTIPIPTTAEACHDINTNMMLCRGCSNTVNAFRVAAKRGVTPKAIETYLALPPLVIPDVLCTQTIQQWRLVGRQAMIDGRDMIDNNRWQDVMNCGVAAACRTGTITYQEANKLRQSIFKLIDPIQMEQDTKRRLNKGGKRDV